MAFVDVVFKTTAGALGLATVVLGADMVYAMSKEAIVGKAPATSLFTGISLCTPLKPSTKYTAAWLGQRRPDRHPYASPLASAAPPTVHRSIDWNSSSAEAPWQARGAKGKARRLFEADQGHSKRVIDLARDQTILKLTSTEFKDRLADVLSLLPELHLSAIPPKLLAKLVLMAPGDIAEQIVLLASLFQGEEDINEVLLTEPTLLIIPFATTAKQFHRLKDLLASPRRITYDVAYSNAGVDHFIALYPHFLLEENVIASFRSLQMYFGKTLDSRGTVVQDYVAGNPGMLLKGYKNIQNAPVHNMASYDDSFRDWWIDPHKGIISSTGF